MVMSLLRRIRRRLRRGAHTRALLAEAAAVFGSKRRVLLDGQKIEGTYDVIASTRPWRKRALQPGGILIATEEPAGFAAVHRFDRGLFIATNDPKWRDLRLHLGSGPVMLPGWINIDNLPYPGVDVVWDLARGIPLRQAQYIFAEHFIEHLTFAQAEEFARHCREALRDDGVLRLSTPNLDWVWHTSVGSGDALQDCFVINRAFRGWGHQFLYNFAALEDLLHRAGFETVRRFAYGESDTAALAGIERHEKSVDTPELPHIIVVEASGRRTAETETPHRMMVEYRRDIGVR